MRLLGLLLFLGLGTLLPAQSICFYMGPHHSALPDRPSIPASVSCFIPAGPGDRFRIEVAPVGEGDSAVVYLDASPNHPPGTYLSTQIALAEDFGPVQATRVVRITETALDTREAK